MKFAKTLKFLVVSSLIVFAVFLLLPTSGNAADGSSQQQAKGACSGRWSLPPLYVGGQDGVVYAEAAYEFDANCRPTLVREVRLDHVPAEVNQPSQEPVESRTIPLQGSDITQGNGGGAVQAVNTCHVRTWEEDAPGLDMIAVQTALTYSWNNSSVTLSNGAVTATTYLTWWFRTAGPWAATGYHSSQVGWANGNASFNCYGGPFCQGGPKYDITLFNYMTVDYQGGCGGFGTFHGAIIPFGRVLHSVWRN